MSDSPNLTDQSNPALNPGQRNVYEEKITAIERRLAHLERIIKVGQILNSTLELEPLLRIITQVATELTNTEACSLLLYHPETEELRFVPSTASAYREEILNIAVPLDNSVAGWIFRKARPILIRDVKEDPRWNSVVDDATEFKTQSILGVPLKSRNEVIGVMELINKQDVQGFGQDDIQIATALASQAAIAVQNARLWDELHQTHANLSDLDAVKTQYVDLASQALKDPLNLALNYAHFLKNNPTLSAAVNEHSTYETALQNALQLRSLIDRLLNIRHLQDADIGLNISIFSMRALVQDVLTEFEGLISLKDLKVKQNFVEGDDPLNIEADYHKINRIVANLIANAIKYTPPGRAMIVGLTRQDEQHRLTFRVADRGQGLSTEQVEHIFRPLSQAELMDDTQIQQGGLSLPITRSLVEAHQGGIQVESILGRGTQFTVVLPISVSD